MDNRYNKGKGKEYCGIIIKRGMARTSLNPFTRPALCSVAATKTKTVSVASCIKARINYYVENQRITLE